MASQDDGARHLDPDVRRVLAAYRAFERGDIDAAVRDLHPRVVWTEPEEFPGGGRRVGVAQVAAYLRASRNMWGELESRPTVTRRGAEVRAVHRVRGRLVDGTPHEALAVDVFRFVDGQVVEMTAYASPEDVPPEA
ncbi:nuclear transport factor 2 family protein [Georgenia sp. SYP-B2076]|uniref:nuclear transport factor 2 family protein n=1 Tax=Georgenia sp. SYP-B2076 TaxID=2495881 RepID=UPI000F8D4A2F|nr:nuclear transport factor 2 family protein [Georgenia sp. SYP-B2076]